MQVEYFRCWPGSDGDNGTWDTDYPQKNLSKVVMDHF